MAYKTGERAQMSLLPDTIENYVSQEDPVRVYDAFIDALDFTALGIKIEPFKSGAHEYFPKQMLKLIVYGYSYNVRSSRNLERACYHNLSFIWLVGGLKPDYRTIARSRSDNKAAIKKVLKQCVQMCIKMNLIEGNVLFIDGSKFRANAGINNTWTKERCQRQIEKSEESIDMLVDEIEQADDAEQGNPSLVRLKEKITDKEALIDRMKQAIREMEQSGKGALNITDKDCVNGKSRQGIHAVYNAQNAIDGKHGLIVNSECVSQSNDYNQLSRQVNEANKVIGDTVRHVCADAGYADVDDLIKISSGINIIVPNKRQAQELKGKTAVGYFDRSRFIYHKEDDEYECPAGKRLTYRGNNAGKQNKTYRTRGGICRGCVYFGECTISRKVGRKIIRHNNEEFKEKIEQNYLKIENQKIYALRKQMVEHPFGHLKNNLGVHQFLLRGKAKVDAEIAVLSTCFNIRRLITIMGIPQLITTIKGLWIQNSIVT